MPEATKDTAEFEKKFAVPGERFHSVTQFGGSTYKITQHYGFRLHTGPGPREEHQHSDVKLSSSISRTRRTVLELDLANDWEYFITLTLDEKKVDRFDLEAWYSKFKEWLKYRRKAYGLKCRYLLVPEQHGDGAWHVHGLISGLDLLELVPFSGMDKAGYRTENGRRLKKDLRESDYLNWHPYSKSFGFCSVGKLRNKDAASFYVVKYITKDLARCVSQCGKHMYWASRHLDRPVKFGEFFERSQYIDSLLVNKYEFCATGFVLPDEGWCSDIAAEIIESVGGVVFSGAVSHPLFDITDEPSAAELEADAYAQFEQLAIDKFRL